MALKGLPLIDWNCRQLYQGRMPISDAEAHQYLGSTPVSQFSTSVGWKLGAKESGGVSKSWPSRWQSATSASSTAPSGHSHGSTWAIEPKQ